MTSTMGLIGSQSFSLWFMTSPLTGRQEVCDLASSWLITMVTLRPATTKDINHSIYEPFICSLSQEIPSNLSLFWVVRVIYRLNSPIMAQLDSLCIHAHYGFHGERCIFQDISFTISMKTSIKGLIYCRLWGIARENIICIKVNAHYIW